MCRWRSPFGRWAVAHRGSLPQNICKSWKACCASSWLTQTPISSKTSRCAAISTSRVLQSRGGAYKVRSVVAGGQGCAGLGTAHLMYQNPSRPRRSSNKAGKHGDGHIGEGNNMCRVNATHSLLKLPFHVLLMGTYCTTLCSRLYSSDLHAITETTTKTTIRGFWLHHKSLHLQSGTQPCAADGTIVRQPFVATCHHNADACSVLWLKCNRRQPSKG
jgi:hypothetical protein